MKQIPKKKKTRHLVKKYQTLNFFFSAKRYFFSHFCNFLLSYDFCCKRLYQEIKENKLCYNEHRFFSVTNIRQSLLRTSVVFIPNIRFFPLRTSIHFLIQKTPKSLVSCDSEHLDEFFSEHPVFSIPNSRTFHSEHPDFYLKYLKVK